MITKFSLKKSKVVNIIVNIKRSPKNVPSVKYLGLHICISLSLCIRHTYMA